jgi:hypothetical protein
LLLLKLLLLLPYQLACSSAHFQAVAVQCCRGILPCRGGCSGVQLLLLLLLPLMLTMRRLLEQGSATKQRWGRHNLHMTQR